MKGSLMVSSPEYIEQLAVLVLYYKCSGFYGCLIGHYKKGDQGSSLDTAMCLPSDVIAHTNYV